MLNKILSESESESEMYFSMHHMGVGIKIEILISIHELGVPLQWRHNGRDGASNHQPHHYSTVCSGIDQKTSKLRVTGLCLGNSPVTGELQITILEISVVSISLNFILIRMDLDPSSTLVQNFGILCHVR